MPLDLSKYAQACARFETELTESLSAKEIELLRRDCEALGLYGWMDWIRENVEEISHIVASSPSDRKRRNSWKDPALKRRLVLASLQHLTNARELLAGIDPLLLPGLSYREMAARAGTAYLDIFYSGSSLWPFDADSPF